MTAAPTGGFCTVTRTSTAGHQIEANLARTPCRPDEPILCEQFFKQSELMIRPTSRPGRRVRHWTRAKVSVPQPRSPARRTPSTGPSNLWLDNPADLTAASHWCGLLPWGSERKTMRHGDGSEKPGLTPRFSLDGIRDVKGHYLVPVCTDVLNAAAFGLTHESPGNGGGLLTAGDIDHGFDGSDPQFA